MLDLFERLIAEGEAGLLRLVEGRTQESVSLEFKTKEKAHYARFDGSDRKNLGKALSGLANSQGGLLVWGVEARREKGDEVDCARRLAPISGIEAFLSYATELAGQLLMPRHDGIRLAAVHATEDSGYLLIYVERSARRPHMSMADHRYHRRAGGSTFPMEHGDLEDAFNRRTTASVSVIKRVLFNAELYGHGLQRRRYSVEVGLQNISKVSARFPYLYIAVSNPPFHVTHHAGLVLGNGWRQSASDGWYKFSGGSHDVVHPNENVWIASAFVEVEHHSDKTEPFVAGEPLKGRSFCIPCRFGCLDAPLSEVTLEFAHSEFAG